VVDVGDNGDVSEGTGHSVGSRNVAVRKRRAFYHVKT
jgi:hypothetical protein